MLQKLRDLLWRSQDLCEYIERIHVREDPGQVRKSIGRKYIRMSLIMLGILVLAGIYCYTQPVEKSMLSGNQLTRQEEDTEARLQIVGQSETNSWQQELTLSVAARQFSKEERDKLTEQVEQYLQRQLPGENTSLDNVNRNLCMPVSIPDTGIEIRWTVDETYLSESGELVYTTLPEEGAETELMAKASWKNWSGTFYFPVHLTAKQYSQKELTILQIEEALRRTEAEQGEEEEVTLPAQIGDTRISYAMENRGKDFTLVYLVLGCLLLLPVLWRQQQKKKLAAREEQLLDDHPGLVNKFMLLLGAGLTVRKVVERLTEEYEQERKKGGRKRYVYEEMCIMAQEMRDGVSESKALEHFGRNCRLLPYLRFSSVLTQNLKKGAEGILEILEKESFAALEQRKERALQLGEKAGTKLLLPMMLMLGIVMAIIMVPAFMTM